MKTFKPPQVQIIRDKHSQPIVSPRPVVISAAALDQRKMLNGALARRSAKQYIANSY